MRAATVAALFFWAMKTIQLKLGAARTRIVVGAGKFGHLRAELDAAGLNPPFLIVTQQKIVQHTGLRSLGRSPVATIPDGERAKTLSTVRTLIDRMLELGLTRDATVVAIGGGVVGDVAGFAASIYLRGIDVVQVPTTLLAQVDSSVGGKTGVNHPAGKNLIGTFHQPRLVVADPSILASLPPREYRSGLYEAVKYGVIQDPTLFRQFERRLQPILDRDPSALEELVYRCLRIKGRIVASDEKELGLRRILNFGHTMGHAIEAGAGYRRIFHGEAVAYGMIGAIRIAKELDLIEDAEALRILKVVDSLGPLPSIRSLSVPAMLQSMRYDKKIRKGTLHFVLPERVGKVRVTGDVSPKLVRSVIRSLS